MLILLYTKFHVNRTLRSISSPGGVLFCADSAPFLIARESEDLGKSRLGPGNREIDRKGRNLSFHTRRTFKFCVWTCSLLILLDTKFHENRTLRSISSPGVYRFVPTRPRFSSPASRKSSARAASRPWKGARPFIFLFHVLVLVPKKGEILF